MITVIRAHDLSDNVHVFSIVADDKKFAYVFEDKNTQIFNPDRRAKMIMDRMKDSSKMSASDLAQVATFGLSNFYFSAPFEEPDMKTATSSEKVALRKARIASQASPSGVDPSTFDDIDQVFSDYPDLYDQLASDDPDQKITADGMTELVFAALGPIDPSGPYGYILKYLDNESPEQEPITAAGELDQCPPATQDIQLNLKNRQNAIDNVGYGPLNPQELSEEFWQEKANRWRVSVEDAKKSRCGNCAAFIVTSKMKDCIAKGLQQGDQNVEDSYDVVVQGELGYCEALDFKCAASRTCDAWITGGPVTDETGK